MATRRSLDETRRRILDAGAEIMAESGWSLQSANVSLIDACRRAGLGTAGSGYKIWPNQEEFREELVRHTLVVEGPRDDAAARLMGAARELGFGEDLREFVRVASNENAEAIIGADWHLKLIAIWLAAATDEAVRTEQLDAQERLLTSLRAAFADLLARFGREMRPPFTLDTLTLAIAAQSNGLAYFCAYDEPEGAWVDRPSRSGGATERWHVLGCAVESLIEAFTRPVPGAHDV